MGSLKIGGDLKWSLKVDKSERMKQDNEEAANVLEYLQKLNYEDVFKDNLETNLENKICIFNIVIKLEGKYK